MKTQYKIVDWMNNRIFPNKVFKSFEDEREYIYKKFDNEEDHQEYFVVDVNEKERGQIWNNSKKCSMILMGLWITWLSIYA